MLHGVQAWQDLKFTAEQQRDFIKEVLGPALRSTPATKDIDLLIMDDQRVHRPGWAGDGFPTLFSSFRSFRSFRSVCFARIVYSGRLRYRPWGGRR